MFSFDPSRPGEDGEYCEEAHVQYIGLDGTRVSLPDRFPLVHSEIWCDAACVLGDGVVFLGSLDEDTTYFYYPREAPDEGLGALLVPDMRSAPSFSAYTVLDGIMHVFGEGDHWTYTPEDGWSQLEVVPQEVGTVTQAQGLQDLAIPIGDNMMLRFSRLDDRITEDITGSRLTLNESLLYPSDEMGWGSLIEWDIDWRRTLGLVQ
ncbi:hypothetical protein KIPB_003821 [Kipferlia bialata]|uniref:Uncharacterized protein n=1 Tax=Kipferlia bialata TaxID=797122 RepID=A0A391NT67_9EUKA|nr:hypothetical protein KIPB_003821 [Kipferlia bialata]|eukprot:g3821.t1